MEKYYIVNKNQKYFLNLCGHYTLADNKIDASVWDDPDHKEMWFYLHELRASTNQEWNVVDEYDSIVNESERARTFECWLTRTIENMEKTIIVEAETFNENFAGRKFVPGNIWATQLFLKGTTKYILIAETEEGYFRYKNSVRDLKDTCDNMWLW